MNAAQLTLNGGEISPTLHHRLDLEKRASSLAQCRNFIPLPTGGARKRPGTYYRKELTDADDNARMFPFRGSDGARYMLVFAPTKFFAYATADDTLHTAALDWPITSAQMHSIRFTAINDIILLTSPHFAPTEIRYTGPTSWTFARPRWTSQAQLDTNLDENCRLTVLSNPVAATWVTATSYVVGNIRLSVDGTREYTCISAHSSGASTQPGVGASWPTRWKPTTYPKGSSVTIRAHVGRTTWTSGLVYTAGDYVIHSGVTYRALSTHTANAFTTPGAEIVVGSFWVVVGEPFNALLSQSHAVWNPASFFEISQRRPDNFFQVELKAITSASGTFTDPIAVSGDWNINTFGIWNGTFAIQESANGGAEWKTIRQYESKGDRNVAETGTAETPVLMRLGFTESTLTAGTGQQRAVLAPVSPYIASTIDLAYISPTKMLGTTRGETASGTTELWTEGAFSRLRGYPACAALHERRLIFASTSYRPVSLWFSEIEDFYHMQPGTDDAGGMFLTLAATSQAPISWLASQRQLFLGTADAEWVVGSDNNDAPITPTNFLARQYSAYGSHLSAPSILAGDAVLFVQRHGNRIREMGYIAARETYDAADLTRLAEHLFYSIDNDSAAPRIKSMAWQTSREPILWVTMTDGTARTFTYIRSERVHAWANLDMAGAIIVSIAVSPTDTDDDAVFFLTKRAGAYYLEEMPPNAQRDSEIGDTSSPAPHRNAPLVYDCQRAYTVAAGGTLPTFAAWVGGKFTLANVSAAATITEANPGTTNATGASQSYIAGVPVTAEITSLPLEGQTESGPSLGKKKRISHLYAYLFKGRGLQAGERIATDGSITFTDFTPSLDHYQRAAANVNDSLYYAGWVRANVNISSLAPCIHLRHTAPAPCTVHVIMANLSIQEP